MASSEAFTMISESKHAGPQLFDSFFEGTSGKLSDLDVHLITDLRAQYPELIVTTVPGNNANLIAFAIAGHATFELDNTPDDPIIRWRGYIPPNHRSAEGYIGESRFFAKYKYSWNDHHFILYVVTIGYTAVQYVLTEPRDGETTLDNSSVVTALLAAIGKWLIADEDIVYVYDNFWQPSKALWNQVQEATWDKVILDPKQKKALADVSAKFFDSKDIYEEYGVPWKRGLIFHGPVGNGKTISIKALMHGLYQRKPKIPSLYVKSARNTYNIKDVFSFARSMTPCLLILEDIETIVTQETRSYFFNEVDGLENNDGILMVATTNYLERLDPGLSKRPSRFDRKYLFPLPNLEQRTLYCEYWRNKLKSKPNIEYPKVLCRAIAKLTDDFSFAYLQEAFVSTLLVLARGGEDDASVDAEGKGEKGHHGDDDDDDDDLDSYDLYRVMRKQVKILRRDMGGGSSSSDDSTFGMSDEEGARLKTRAAAPELDERVHHYSKAAFSRNTSMGESAFLYGHENRSAGKATMLPTAGGKGARLALADRSGPVRTAQFDPDDAVQGMSKIRDFKESAYTYCPKP